MKYRCSTCGELHDDLPDIGMHKPDQWWDVPDDEEDKRVEFSSDICIIDNEDSFIRGIVEIPVIDYVRSFGLGVWVSQKQQNLRKYLDNYDSSKIGPFFGWLCNRITYYEEETLFLKTMAHFRGEGLRPRIEMEATDHPLAVDQRTGITLQKAWDIVHYYSDSDEKGV